MKRHPWLVRGRWKFRRGFGKKPGIPAGRPAVHSADNVSELVTREKLGRIYFGRRDYVDPEMVILNVKALGYEIARLLAERTASRTIDRPPNFPLKSKICTQSDIESDWFLFWAREMTLAPVYHRKLWEFCYVAQALWSARKLMPTMCGLGFGCGQEPLPSLFAKYGVKILATDQPRPREWDASVQHAGRVEVVRYREICPDAGLLENIAFLPIDMKAIPGNLTGAFDFCWSSCALEHLGSLANGLRFVEESLKTLKPGGTAVHTTEFNLGNGVTLDNRQTVLYQKKHIIALAERLRAGGYEVAELDFSYGNGFMDHFVDLPPLTDYPGASHLKLYIQGFACTSFGLIVNAPSARQD
jgi:SAM-dependent methyltransferase